MNLDFTSITTVLIHFCLIQQNTFSFVMKKFRQPIEKETIKYLFFGGFLHEVYSINSMSCYLNKLVQ